MLSVLGGERNSRGREGRQLVCMQQISQALASVFIRGLQLTAVLECYLLASGIFSLEMLLITPLPCSSGRVSSCKAESGKQQGERCHALISKAADAMPLNADFVEWR